MEQKKIDELNGSYLRDVPPADRGNVAGKHLKDFVLKPGDPENCPGLGLDPEIECQCDGCDHLMSCAGKFPRGSVPREAMADVPWWKDSK